MSVPRCLRRDTAQPPPCAPPTACRLAPAEAGRGYHESLCECFSVPTHPHGVCLRALHGQQVDVVEEVGVWRDGREGEVPAGAVRAAGAHAHQRTLARPHAQQRGAQARAVGRV